jgi:hypothetical protein
MPRWLKIISEVTCVHCGHKHADHMPKYATKISYQCPACKEISKPLKDSCCIYCSYGSEPCPKKQASLRTLNLLENDDLEGDVLV